MISFIYWSGTFFGAILGVIGIRLEENPIYTVLQKDGAFEIRKYEPFVEAYVEMSGSNEKARSEAFMVLANYIFGENQAQQKIKMTAPVTQAPASEKISMTAPVTQYPDANTMSFMMPSRYKLEDLPTPNNLKIKFRRREAQTMAVVRFSGLTEPDTVVEQQKRLLEWLQRQNKFTVAGSARQANYDAPFSIPFLRRNEIQIPVN